MNVTKDRKRKIRKKRKQKKTGTRKKHLLYYIVTESVAYLPCAKVTKKEEKRRK